MWTVKQMRTYGQIEGPLQQENMAQLQEDVQYGGL
jgi:hypothetical protein